MKKPIILAAVLCFSAASAFAFTQHAIAAQVNSSVKTLPNNILPLDMKTVNGQQYVLTKTDLWVGKDNVSLKKDYSFQADFVPYQLHVNQDGSVAIQGKLKNQQGKLVSDVNHHWQFVE